MSDTLIILFVFVFGYFLMALILFLRQDRLVYFPSNEIVWFPSDLKLPYREVEFKTGDGFRLYGWMVGEEDFRNVVLFFHGNASNISHNLDFLPVFHRLGLKAFIFDYRGYGQSEGTPSEAGTYLDAEAAWDYLTKTQGISRDQVIFYGHSLGAAVAAHLAEKVKPGALVLEAAFTSVPDLGRSMFPFLPVRLLCKFRYNTKTLLPKITIPVLVIHSPNDEMIPYAHGEVLYKVANNPKQFLKIFGSHNEGFTNCEDLYIAGLRSFLSACGLL
ncbi:MAG: alpha/beta hydrolase [Candidatus Aminicenantes bacterium]|nr:MAG: alpha/beta hydrolase [Candidatus Aminicenantes bacterium]